MLDELRTVYLVFSLSFSPGRRIFAQIAVVSGPVPCTVNNKRAFMNAGAFVSQNMHAKACLKRA